MGMDTEGAPAVLRCGRHRLALDRPRIMGILNVTPDSFSDGGAHQRVEQALEHARTMVEQGADLIDIGGESTRPGAQPVALDEERRRVLPVVEALAAELDVPLSVDTMKPALMPEAVAAGATLLNDVNGFRAEGAWEAAVAAAREQGVALCAMHMQGEPQSMQQAPHYNDVAREVGAFLRDRREAFARDGVPAEQLLLDPGFGFGKTLEHNLALFHALPALAELGSPLLVGVSRKSMIGALLGDCPVQERDAGSAIAALLAAQAGARVLRVHDVAGTHDALALYSALTPQAWRGSRQS
ncbi:MULTISPECIES: dihydropteroate synthase [unclassified Thioalkalivibrio]|uniref:dihydropteroate synthase n=1 Tax=unclassified Thioalkalivibrio TaxID=2621013 RepID=UPI00037669AC|nr:MULTISPECIES: dihydropteroate synthase [unclassified Thioalkalivibrio]